jgi:hypothetical protein
VYLYIPLYYVTDVRIGQLVWCRRGDIYLPAVVSAVDNSCDPPQYIVILEPDNKEIYTDKDRLSPRTGE